MGLENDRKISSHHNAVKFNARRKIRSAELNQAR